MKVKTTRLLNWLNGWRQDLEGWWVRARKASDHSFLQDHDPTGGLGFVEEACVAVRFPETARQMDLYAQKVGQEAATREYYEGD